jgi:hypothetical protein
VTAAGVGVPLMGSMSSLVFPLGVNLIGWRGRARFSGLPLRAVYLGNGRNAAFLRGLFFADAEQTVLARYRTPWHARRFRPPESAADLGLSELPAAWAVMGSPAATLDVPAWVRQTLTLPGPDPGHRLLPRGAEREAERHIRRQGYRLTLSAGAEETRRFYHELYAPYVRARFGAAAVLIPEAAFIAASRHQQLASLYAGERRVAAMLLRRRGAHMRLGWFGMLTEPAPKGASEALDLLVIRQAHAEGVRSVVMGNSRPCLSDGVFRYKRRLGAQPQATRFPQSRLHIHLTRMTPTVRQCLAQQPLLTDRPGPDLGVYRLCGDELRLEPFHGAQP